MAHTTGSCRRVLPILAFFILLVVVGCSPGYVMRAAYEEALFLWRREPITRVLAQGGLEPTMRGKLETVLSVRHFAEGHLGLRVGGSYGAISEVGRRAVVQLLTAARRDRLESVKWWFPVVGSVPYKGFFSKNAAEDERVTLEQAGYDTYLRPAIAFSTLGWFDDPLPSTLLKTDSVTLVEVVLHELFHNTLFVPGEITFNESAATFAGHRGAVEFFCSGAGEEVTADCRTARDRWQDTLEMSRFIDGAIDELAAFFASDPQGIELDEGRARIYAWIRERFRRLPLRTKQYSGFGADTLNNASLLQDRTYLRDLDVFEELQGRRGGLAGAVAALHDATGRGGNPFARLAEAAAAARPEVASKGTL